MRLVNLLGFVHVLLFLSQTTLAAPSFTPLAGDSPGGGFLSRANSISSNGNFVVGESQGSDGLHAVMWENGTIRDLGLGTATDVSQDGSFVVGQLTQGVNTFATRWERRTTSFGSVFYLGVALGTFSASNKAMGVSDDGSVVVGTHMASGGPRAFRWSSATGLVDLPGFNFPGSDPGIARGVSSDGNVIVGVTSPFNYPFRWTASGGTTILLVPLVSSKTFTAVSPDGLVTMGSFSDYQTSSTWGFAGDQEVSLRIPGQTYDPESVVQPLASNTDGSLVVGRLQNDAFMWSAQAGYRTLDEILLALGVLPSGWHLTSATGITPDGMTVAGYGTNPNGDTQAWVATIPEPSTALLILVASAWPVLRRTFRR